MPWRRRVKRFLLLPLPEKARILLYTSAFPAVAAALRVSRFQTVIDTMARIGQLWPRRLSRSELSAERIAELVDMASRATIINPNCLQCSVVLWWALRVEAWDSEIRFGVRKRSNDDGFDFHAWVMRDGRVINDHPSVEHSFIPLTTPTDLPPEARFV